MKALDAYIFCLKNKIKSENKNYHYIGNFVYHYVVINASKLTEAYILLNDYNQDEKIYIGRIKIGFNDNPNLYEEAIINYLFKSITLNFIIYDTIIKETWKEIDRNPILFKYVQEQSQGIDVHTELREHAQMQASISKLFYKLENVEGSLNEINYKLSRLNVLIKEDHFFEKYSTILQNLKIEQKRLYNEFNIIDNKVSTLSRIKNCQIETLTSMLTQDNMNAIRKSNDYQYKLHSQSAAESAKGDVVEITLIWLAIMQVYGIFSEIIDNYFVLKFGFDLIPAKIFIAIIFLWLTFLLLKVGRIFVKKEYSMMKEEKRLLTEEE